MSTARRLAAPLLVAAALLMGVSLARAQDSQSNTPPQSDAAPRAGGAGFGYGMMGPGFGGPGFGDPGYGMMGRGYDGRGYGMMGPGYDGRGYGPYGRRDAERDFAERGRRGGPGRFGMGMMWQEDGSAHLEGRIAFVGAELHLTDAQKPAWATFAEALRANGKRQDTLRGAMRGLMFSNSPTDLAGRLDQEEQFLSTQLDSVRALKAALAPLVAVLEDNQRRTLSELSPFGMVGMMGWGAEPRRFGG